MDNTLNDIEGLCLKIMDTIDEELDDRIFSIKTKIENLLPKIRESKKKIMVKSPKGKKLTEEILLNVNSLYEVISKVRYSDLEENVEKVNGKFKSFENSLKKLEIYWKSYEYVTT
jgi:hypothetical protein